MPDFATPYSCKVSERKLNKKELIRAIRFSIASEYEAIQLYEEIEESIDNTEAKRLLKEISEDEKKHAGNFLHLLEILAPKEQKFYETGMLEAQKIVKGN